MLLQGFALLGRGQHLAALCSLVAIQRNAAYIWFPLSPVMVAKGPGAQPKLDSAELRQRLATWKQRYQEKPPLKVGVLDFTVLRPTMWSGTNSAGSWSWQSTRGSPGQSPCFTKEDSPRREFVRSLACLLLNSPMKEFLQMTLLPPNYLVF